MSFLQPLQPQVAITEMTYLISLHYPVTALKTSSLGNLGRMGPQPVNMWYGVVYYLFCGKTLEMFISDMLKRSVTVAQKVAR